MSAIPTFLNEILKKVSELDAQKLRTLAVFDLDSTLFNVSTRTQTILSEFAELNQIEKLKNVEVKQEDRGIKEALLRAGYSLDTDLEMLKTLRDFWSERFFSNEYLHYDVPYLGAVSFVQALEDAGCEIKYLTGRDYARMHKGTIEVLNKWGFPLKENSLFLKPEKTQDDELFKHDWFRDFDMKPFKKIYFFENEPINVNAIIGSFPEIEVVFLDTTHARKQEVTAEIQKIKHFGKGS